MRKFGFRTRILALCTVSVISALIFGEQYTQTTRYELDGAECNEVLLTPNRDCLRILEFKQSFEFGLGHQLSELVFAAYLSRRFEAAMKFPRFDTDLISTHHNDDYSFVQDFLGLNMFTSNSDLNTSALMHAQLTDLSNQECNVVFKGAWNGCEENSTCFHSFLVHSAFRQLAPCFRSASIRNGSWKSASPFPERASGIHIVWHIRVGDVELHPAGDIFYKNLFDDLFSALHTTKVVLYFIAEWRVLKAEERQAYEDYLNNLIFGRWRTIFISLSIHETLAYMMHADVLIGSGSSLPAVAALFSDSTVYVNVMPKHGWNAQFEFIDGLVAGQDGHLLNHAFEIQKMLCTRRHRCMYDVVT